MHFTDKVISIFSPQMGLKRIESRLKLELLNSGYSQGGASRQKNSLKEFKAFSGSPKRDIDFNLDILRQRSRILYMNAPIATSVIRNNRTNVVGSGLRLKSRIDFEFLGITQKQADSWEKQVEREFELWAKGVFCDITRLNNFYELQQIALVGWLMNGDSFALLRHGTPTKNMPYELRIQLIEADRICNPRNKVSNNMEIDLNNGNKIINGVEVNKLGEVVAYHICNKYPTDLGKEEWARVEAFGKLTGNRNVVHILECERAEQYRGVPYLAPVIESLKQITRYTDAELMAAVINGMFSVFIEIEKGESLDAGFGGDDDDDNNFNNAQKEHKLGNGTFNYLNPGEKISTVDPNRPNINFDNFVKGMCKQIGGALEVPHEMILKDFNSSYSASRASLLEAWKAFRMRRTWFANDFCQPIYESFLEEAVAKGRIKAPGFFKDPLIRMAYCSCEWNGPAQGQIDPVKEVKASGMKVEYGFSTREQETIQLTGGDFDRNVEQLQLEDTKMKNINKE